MAVRDDSNDIRNTAVKRDLRMVSSVTYQARSLLDIAYKPLERRK